jgi:hypothetical protein
MYILNIITGCKVNDESMFCILFPRSWIHISVRFGMHLKLACVDINFYLVTPWSIRQKSYKAFNLQYPTH